MMSRVAIILVPYHLDEFLPDLDPPLPPGHDVTTVVEPLPDGDTWGRLAALYHPVADLVTRHTRAGRPVRVVSGDCTTALATMAGLRHAGLDPGVVWFDAHGDLQTPETTTSGYLGGMPLRLLLGYRPDLIGTALGLAPVPPERTLLVGARDLDPPEAEYLATAPVGRVDVPALAADDLPAGPLLVHLDLDVLDDGELPGLRYPVGGGPTAGELLDAVDRILATGRVAALEVACTWYPGRPDPDGRRAALLARLLA